ncbi:hypothetical protein D8Y22_17695 [Salinadaptatus halalkaliphilus]|uniref:Uncharacterized protein n=1 Tax=Salinadaptatus halalkaliphilus TaxID=2419781 RepID=A0A4S3TI82_9EURY|nr:hypothetical protein D8Y22_17695 [Salinadaptatus halalkaliphilus]
MAVSGPIVDTADATISNGRCVAEDPPNGGQTGPRTGIDRIRRPTPTTVEPMFSMADSIDRRPTDTGI